MFLNTRNVNQAYREGLALLLREGKRQQSRAGEVLVLPHPQVTLYRNPMERVLFDPKRDANPFFHLMEALWMLAGRNDTRWLDQFVHDFSSRFAEDDGHQHGAYGFRWRKHFDVEGGGDMVRLPDQFETVITLLKKDPDDRRVVITMWDPVADLASKKRDIPCNTHIYLRVRRQQEPHELGIDVNNLNPDGSDFHLMNALEETSVLDITVCCRSNDAVWGAHGANAVHFAVLQEYLAARIGIKVGFFYQLSNNYHVYTNILDKLGSPALMPYEEPYEHTRPTPIVTVSDSFDFDLAKFFGGYWDQATYENMFFHHIAVPLRKAYGLWRLKERKRALRIVSDLDVMSDWVLAAEAWMLRRMS